MDSAQATPWDRTRVSVCSPPSPPLPRRCWLQISWTFSWVTFFRANKWSIMSLKQKQVITFTYSVRQKCCLAERKLPVLACNIKVTSKPPLALAKEERSRRRGRRREHGAENVRRNGSCCSEVGELDRTGQRDTAQRQTSQTKPMCILGQRCTFPNARLTLNTTERRTTALVLTH